MQVGKDFMSVEQDEFNGFRETIPEDCFYLADKLRYEDKREIIASTGMPPRNALIKSYAHSQDCFTILDTNDVPCGIFGVSKNGGIWLLASDDIYRIRFSFLRESKKVVQFLNTKYNPLWNYVDCRNTLHIKWLKWCGFVFLRKINYGVLNLPFYEFIRVCVSNQQQH